MNCLALCSYSSVNGTIADEINILDRETVLLSLNDDQTNQLDHFYDFVMSKADARLATLRGYAGTGKTYLIACLLLKLRATGFRSRIAIAAPTNKAVTVLQERIKSIIDMKDAFNINFGSIHSFLGLRLKELENGEQECLQEGDSTLDQYGLVIIDESSMIGKEMSVAINQSIAFSDTKVIFVGDPFQFPEVNGPEGQESPVFSDELIDGRNIRILTRIVRQEEGNPIIELSKNIRQSIETDKRVSQNDLERWLAGCEKKAAIVSGGSKRIIDLFIQAREKFNDDVRILAYTNKQVLSFNDDLHDYFYPESKTPFCAGERVIVHAQHEGYDANGQDGKLITSEEAVVLDIERFDHPSFITDVYIKNSDDVIDETAFASCYKIVLETQDFNYGRKETIVYFPAYEKRHEASINGFFKKWSREKNKGNREAARDYSSFAWKLRNRFIQLRHAYAMTLHKSQGSTFDTAIIDFNDISRIKSNFYFNRALYVAVTRPRYRLAIVTK